MANLGRFADRQRLEVRMTGFGENGRGMKLLPHYPAILDVRITPLSTHHQIKGLGYVSLKQPACELRPRQCTRSAITLTRARISV
jgi:hypothetical protein